MPIRKGERREAKCYEMKKMININEVTLEANKAIEDSNRTLKDCPFGSVDISRDQIEIFIIPGEFPCLGAAVPVDLWLNWLKDMLYVNCQQLYGAMSALLSQKNQSRERLDYLNFMKYILECSIRDINLKDTVLIR